MLLETTNSGFQINDTVMVTATSQIGTIVGYESGKWRIAVSGDTLLKESTEIKKRKILLG